MSSTPNSDSNGSAPRPEAPSGGRFSLAVFDDHLRSLPLAEGTILVGRSKQNQLPLHDHLLSRKHCSITVGADGLTLVDLNSSNGTYVNGQQVETKILQQDDIIELGKTVLVVFDGECWQRGEGLLNLRNPIKAQKLVQRLREGSVAREDFDRPAAEAGSHSRDRQAKDRISKDRISKDRTSKDSGVRAVKGITDIERGFLRRLERDESAVLPELISNYLSHKLVSLLLRHSKTARAAFTGALEELMDSDVLNETTSPREFQEIVTKLVEAELAAVRAQSRSNATAKEASSQIIPTAASAAGSLSGSVVLEDASLEDPEFEDSPLWSDEDA